MKLFKLLVLALFIITLFQFNLFSTITSRIDGVVIDKETGQPIKGAYVQLGIISGDASKGFACSWPHYSLDFDGETDSKGRFKIDYLTVEENADYFWVIFKDGYEGYGPFIDKFNFMNFEHLKQFHGIYNDYAKIQNKEGAAPFAGKIDTFHLKQGQVKHVIIKLEKEAFLDFRIYRKTPSGLHPLKDGQYFVYHNKYYQKADTNLKMGCLKPGIVFVELYPPGYFYHTKSGIVLERGKTTVVEHVLDFTKGQVLHGIVKSKTTGKPMHVRASIVEIDPKEDSLTIEGCYTDDQGEFWLGGFNPGKYKLWIIGFKNNEYNEIIEFKANQKITKTWEF